MKLDVLFDSGLPAKPKKTRSLLTAAELERRLSAHEVTKNAYEVRSIWISGIGRIVPETWILDYWCPLPRKEDWKRRCYTEVGDTVHRILQEHWHGAGILVPQEETFQERRVFCDNFGFSGKLDAMFNAKKILEKELPDIHGEIKVVNSHYYKEWQHPEALPEDYRTQATVYQKLLNTDKTCFVLVNRDSFDFRTLFYCGEERLWEDAKRLAKILWSHVAAKTFPGEWAQEIPFSEWVEAQIQAQPGREFRVFPCV